MSVELSRIWAVVPCMGRLQFLQQTLPAFFGQPELRYCLIDYSCPDGCGRWAESGFSRELSQGRLVVERVPGQPHFHKCRAYNVGARSAMARGAEFLCFLDADTIVRPGFAKWLGDHLVHGRFFIAARTGAGKHVRSTGGLIALSAADFVRAGGYDEAFVGWGGEDVELRLRLFLAAHLEYEDVPLELIEPIRHSDEVRGRHFAVKNIRESERANRAIVERKVKMWTGGGTPELGQSARRLLMGRIWDTPLGQARSGLHPRAPSRWMRTTWR